MTTAQPSNRSMIIPTPSGDFDIKIPESAGVTPAEEPAAPTPQPSIYEPPVAPEEHYPLAETEPTVSTPQQPRTERRREVEQKKEPPVVEKGKKVEKPAEKKVEAHPPGKKPVTKKEIVEAKKPTLEQAQKPKKPTEEPPPSAEEAVAPPPAQLPQGAWEATEDLERGEEKLVKKVAPVKKEEPVIPTTFQTGAPPAAPVILPGGEPLQPLTAPFANLPAPVAALFERMVGVMTVMNTPGSGVTETTINLDNPKFANSVFYGTQIIITEFNRPESLQHPTAWESAGHYSHRQQQTGIAAAFQAGNYTFKVNRIDTGISPLPLEERKREARRVKRKKGATIPQPIELDKIEKKELPKRESTKQPTQYKKNKSSLPEQIEADSLQVIKQFIANQSSEPLNISIDPSSQVGALYDKLLSAIIGTHTEGVQETTFFLDGDAFNTFQGARITITEYSTAPKVFNIEFSSHSKAVALFESHAAEFDDRPAKTGSWLFSLPNRYLLRERTISCQKESRARGRR